MAISNTNKTLSLPLLAFSITIFLFLLNNRVLSSSVETSFYFPYFEKEQPENLKLQGIATTNTTSKILKLSSFNDGFPYSQVTYRAPFCLWDDSVVASFDTNFTFTISSPPNNPYKPGNGFTFFISSIKNETLRSSIQDYEGGLLGLFRYGTPPESEKVVAIEFDTFTDPEYDDPNYSHIGIDINSPKSNKTIEWEWRNGEVGTAIIKYDSSFKTLTVEAYYVGVDEVSLTQVVDLTTILPQYVQVGFTASIGNSSEENTIIQTWAFSSTLNRIN